MRRALALALLSVLLIPSAASAAADPHRPSQWGLQTIGAPEAWRVGRGRGVVIAVVDTGVDLRHEDLAGRLLPGRDFVDDDGDPQDEHGHGTHVAGVAAATAGNGRGVAGVAPGARILPVRVLDEDGAGSSRDVARGIRWAVDRGARVVNLSLGDLGQPLFGPAFDDAIAYAWSHGAVPVVAAGNEFLLSSGYSDQNALVVSATDRNDRKPAYSSGVGGAKWGMAAPGGAGGPTAHDEEDVLSTYWAPGRRNAYAYLAGTSMAAPHVAGAAAILLGLGLSPRETVQRLLTTARDVGSQGRDRTFGHGRLDAAAATAGLGGGSSGATSEAETAAPAEREAAPSEASPTSEAPIPDQEAEAAPTAPPDEAREARPDGTAAGGGGTPIAPIAAGVLALVLAAAVSWVLFRPGPE